MTKKYKNPSRITPSFVVLWNSKGYLGKAPCYIFPTLWAAREYWWKHSGRQENEAFIEHMSFNNKAEMLTTIQHLLAGA